MLSVQDFAAKVKAKYPEYQNVDDTTLTQKIIAKYPEYQSQVDMSGNKQQITPPIQQPAQSQSSGNPLGAVGDFVNNLGGSIAKGAQNFVKREAPQLQEAMNKESTIGIGERLGNVAGQAAGGIANVGIGAANVLGGALSQLNPFDTRTPTEKTDQAIGGLNQAVGGVGQAISSPLAASPVLSKAASLPFEGAHELISGTLNKLGIDTTTEHGKAVADSWMNGLTMAAIGPKNIAEGVTGAIDVAKRAPELIPEPMKQAMQEKVVQGAKDDWAKPATGVKPIAKAADIYNHALDNGHNISETLVNNKINPADNITDGNYATADTAHRMRTDAGKMSAEVLRPSLEKANEITPPTPVTDIFDTARQNIEDNNKITAEDKVTMQKKLAKIQTVLTDKYPNGMSLTDLLDEKITRDANAGYKPMGTIADNATATINKALADSSRGLLEQNAPEGIPVKEFNAELSKQYQAADYLEALDGKRAPKSTASKLAKSLAQGAGATAAGALGGGIFGGFAGYHVGGMLENLFENVPNPIKQHFMDNLEKTNPVAATKITEWMNSPEAQQKLLPAPNQP